MIYIRINKNVSITHSVSFIFVIKYAKSYDFNNFIPFSSFYIYIFKANNSDE